MSLVSQLQTAMTRIATEINAVRAEIAAKTDAIQVIHKLRTTDSTAKNANTTVANDDALTSTVPVGTWILEGSIGWKGSSAADVRMDFAIPSGATGSYRGLGLAVASTSLAAASVSWRGETSFGTDFVVASVTGETSWTEIRGHLVVGTSGTFAVRWAQQNSDASDLVMAAGSWMRLTRVS